MQEVFLPDLVSGYRWFSLCVIGGLAGLALAVAAFRRSDFPVRPAAQLMGLVFATVGLLGAAFVLWDLVRTPAIVVSEDYLLLGNDTIPANRVNKTYLETVSEYNIMGEPTVDTVGVLELHGGEVRLFSAERYPVRELILATRRMNRDGRAPGD